MARSPLMAFVVIAVIGMFARSSMACTVTGINVATIMDPRTPNGTLPTYTDAEVHEALNGVGAFATNEDGTPIYVDPAHVTWSCVDSRGEDNPSIDKLQTPGGDISELAMGIVIYARMMNMTATFEQIAEVLAAFLEYTITPERPFYYHTDVAKLNKAFTQVANLTGMTTPPIVMPNVQPEDIATAEAWYTALTAPENQGCGHVRLTMTYPDQYGLTPDEYSYLPNLVRAFYASWWPTDQTSPMRNMNYFSILPGALTGESVALINNTGPGCAGHYPEVVPAHGGSTMFIYQGVAVEDFRSQTIGPFFASIAAEQNRTEMFNMDTFLSELSALAGVQLTSTLTLLAPVDELPVMLVSLESEMV